MYGTFFIPHRQVGNLPIRREWWHNATKEWVRTILMSNNRAKALGLLPVLPIEMWGFIVSLILTKTFKNHGLDPIKTITEWNKILDAPLELTLAGSSVLHHHHWRGWDVGDWDLYVRDMPTNAALVISRAMGCTPMVNPLNDPDDDTELPPGCSIKVYNSMPMVRIVWEGFDINVIVELVDGFTSYDIVEAGYHYDFRTRDGEHIGWCDPEKFEIGHLEKPAQWTFNVLSQQILKEAIKRIVWEERLKADLVRYGDDAERFEKQMEQELNLQGNKITSAGRMMTAYQRNTLDRICTYTGRAKSAGIPLVINTVDDIDKAVKILTYLQIYVM